MKSLLKTLLYPLLAILLLSIVLELVLGVVFYIKDYNLEPMHVKDYPYLYYLFTKQDDTNSDGFKTKHTITKPEGKYRIILVGGSVARGKKLQNSIATLLEHDLNERLHTDKIEVINAGISAFVVEQEFILSQLVLQQYSPDMIIGLDGYNDLMTFQFNRMYPADFKLPPHNWKDFRVIHDHRLRNKWYGRFAYFFKNINRLVAYFKRRSFEKNYHWDSISDSENTAIAEIFWKVVDDTRDFCRSKDISYYSFLQPIRFYAKKQLGQEVTTRENALSKMYAQFEQQAANKTYTHSLTQVLNQELQLFTDDCHVTTEGNEMIAAAMADILSTPVRQALSDTTSTSAY